MKVTVLRGISGSGKTTWANQQKGALIISTDLFFIKDGVYVYDRSKLEDYHRQSFRQFIEAILRSEPWIIVDNTNIMPWDYAPFVTVGEAYHYETEILTFPCSVEVSRGRKTLVPPEELERMYDRLEDATRRMPARFKKIHRFMSA